MLLICRGFDDSQMEELRVGALEEASVSLSFSQLEPWLPQRQASNSGCVLGS